MARSATIPAFSAGAQHLSYWVVVPDVDLPELIVFELRDGRYQQVAHVTGGKPFRAERPFPVEVVPAHLVAGLLPD